MNLKSITAKSDAGPTLETNQDLYDMDLINGLFMVLDGFGGANLGDIAARSIKEKVKKFYVDISSDKNSTLPFFYSPKYLVEGNALINAMLFSHKEIFNDNLQKDAPLRAGAAGVFASLAENIVTLVGTGNCAAFLIRNGRTEQIISPDDYNLLSGPNAKNKHVTMPLSGFGLFPDLAYQAKEVRVQEKDLIVMLSDGIYGEIDNQEISAMILRSAQNFKKCIDDVFSLANQVGNTDNQTMMILEF